MFRMSSKVQGLRGYLSSKSEKVVSATVAFQEVSGSESLEQVNLGDDKISRLGSGQQEQGDMKNEEMTMIGSNTDAERQGERKKWQLTRMGSSLRIFCDIEAT